MKKKTKAKTSPAEAFFLKVKKEYADSAPVLSKDVSGQILKKLNNNYNPSRKNRFYYIITASAVSGAAALFLTTLFALHLISPDGINLSVFSCRSGFINAEGLPVTESELTLQKNETVKLYYKKGYMILSGPGVFRLTECGMDVFIAFGTIQILSEGSIPENRLHWKTRNTEYTMTGTDAYLNVAVTGQEHISVKEGSFTASVRDSTTGSVRHIRIAAGESATSDPVKGEILLGKYQDPVTEPFNP